MMVMFVSFWTLPECQKCSAPLSHRIPASLQLQRSWFRISSSFLHIIQIEGPSYRLFLNLSQIRTFRFNSNHKKVEIFGQIPSCQMHCQSFFHTTSVRPTYYRYTSLNLNVSSPLFPHLRISYPFLSLIFLRCKHLLKMKCGKYLVSNLVRVPRLVNDMGLSINQIQGSNMRIKIVILYII